MNELLLNFVSLFFSALQLAILARIIMSWIGAIGETNPIIETINQLLNQITEPLLAPIRRVVPPFGMFDLTPMIAFLVLGFARDFLL